MLTKKLKKIRKECRKTDDPVLLTLAAYIDHVVTYLRHAADDDHALNELRIALSQLDLSAIAKARETLTAALIAAKQQAGNSSVVPSDARKNANEKKKRGRK
ncbi:MAG: hypothetical protein HUU20_11415 [Pirellulales bacterium]|nr:hypothetical protein [Pirellulales bacterium]